MLRAWIYFLLPFVSFAVPAPPNRLPSTPFISGDTFRFFADYVFDEVDSSLNPREVKPGSTIFVKTDLLNRFFYEIHPHIQNRYILISHNSDEAAPGIYASFLDDFKLIAWFGQNYDGYPHPKMHPIPIGLANFHWPHGNFHAIQNAKQNSPFKLHLVYLNLSIGTYRQERQKVYNLISGKRFCYQTEGRNYTQFLDDLASSYFVIAARGNGLDTHRLWEALCMGSIPIVKSSPLDPLYDGLPVLVVSNWDEVTEPFLRAKTEEINSKPYFMERLTIHYWISKIEAYKKEALL